VLQTAFVLCSDVLMMLTTAMTTLIAFVLRSDAPMMLTTAVATLISVVYCVLLC
jgi:hypothetical protein